MLVRFKVNLGSNDALPLKLEFKHCGRGMTADVSPGLELAAYFERIGYTGSTEATVDTLRLSRAMNDSTSL